MKYLFLLLVLSQSLMAQTNNMKMQHGFILVNNDTFASHLVANGHHSRQVSISGKLIITNTRDKQVYVEHKNKNIPTEQVYFLFQAQSLDLPTLKRGQVLQGHIIESRLGDYDPENKVVFDAQFLVHKVHINILNPFFQ